MGTCRIPHPPGLPLLASMGCGGSKDRTRGPENERAAGFFIIDWRRGNNVPKMDSFDTESDPFLKVWLESKNGINLCEKDVFTQGRRSTTDPVWESIRDFGFVPDAEDILVAELYDKDTLTSDDLIGAVRIPVSKLDMQKEIELEIELTKEASESMVVKDGKPVHCTITFMRCPAPTKQEITFFIIRHGESKWNEAMNDKAVGAMIDTDHALNIVGINQAVEFNKRWKCCKPEDEPDHVAEKIKLFFASKRAVASPLTRAVQTALVGLWDHPALSGSGLTLSRLIREQKNAGGFDTVGSKVGDEIAAEAEKCLGEELEKEHEQSGDDAAASAKKYMVAIDPGDATSDWWTKINDKDSQEQIRSRLLDWLNAAYFRCEHGTIFVGHSLYNKALMCHFTANVLKTKNKDLFDKLQVSKLCNAGCAAVTVNFNDPKNPEVVDVELLFDTKLEAH